MFHFILALIFLSKLFTSSRYSAPKKKQKIPFRTVVLYCGACASPVGHGNILVGLGGLRHCEPILVGIQNKKCTFSQSIKLNCAWWITCLLLHFIKFFTNYLLYYITFAAITRNPLQITKRADLKLKLTKMDWNLELNRYLTSTKRRAPISGATREAKGVSALFHCFGYDLK